MKQIRQGGIDNNFQSLIGMRSSGTPIIKQSRRLENGFIKKDVQRSEDDVDQEISAARMEMLMCLKA